MKLIPQRFITPLRYLLSRMFSPFPFKEKLIRALSFPKEKERYPGYIVRSDRRYRENRSMLLSARIGKNFRALREGRQLSLEQVAIEIGIPADVLHQLESGALEVTPTMLVIISDYFGVATDYLIYLDLSLEQ